MINQCSRCCMLCYHAISVKRKKAPQMPQYKKSPSNSPADKITYFCPAKTAYSKSHLSMTGCYPLSVKSHPHRWLIPVDHRRSPVMVVFSQLLWQWGMKAIIYGSQCWMRRTWYYLLAITWGIKKEKYIYFFFNNFETFVQTIPLERWLQITAGRSCLL